MIRRSFRGACLLAAALVWLVGSGSWALAQSVSPNAKRPTVTGGQVTGSIVQGGTLTIRVDAQMVGGWRGLHLVEVSVLAGGSAIEHITYDIEDDKLSLGDQDIAVGTGAVAEGEYMRVSGSDVVVTSGGADLSFRVEADVTKTITEEPRFRLGVTNDFGYSDSITLRLNEPEGARTTWGTVVTFAVAALFLGVFVGNLFASKRRPPRRQSIYEAVQLRIEHERAGRDSSS